MKILIQGAGAMGRLFLARLQPLAAVDQLGLLDRDLERALAFAEHGLRWRSSAPPDPTVDSTAASTGGERGPWNHVDVNPYLIPSRMIGVSAALEELPPTPGVPRIRDASSAAWDLIIVCVKSYDVESCFDDIREWVGASAHDPPVILTLSNGLGHLELAEQRLGRDNVLVGTTTLGASYDDDLGRDTSSRETVNSIHDGKASPNVTLHGNGTLRIGGRGNSASRAMQVLERLIGALASGGFDVERVADISQAVWEKVALNCAINALGAVLRVENGALLRQDLLDTGAKIAREVAALARIRGKSLPEEGWQQRIGEVCRATAANRCSMLRDLDLGRRTEVDHLNGAVVRWSEESGVDAPLNESFAALVRALQGAPCGGVANPESAAVSIDELPTSRVRDHFVEPRIVEPRASEECRERVGDRRPWCDAWARSPESIMG